MNSHCLGVARKCKESSPMSSLLHTVLLPSCHCVLVHLSHVHEILHMQCPRGALPLPNKGEGETRCAPSPRCWATHWCSRRQCNHVQPLQIELWRCFEGVRERCCTASADPSTSHTLAAVELVTSVTDIGTWDLAGAAWG